MHQLEKRGTWYMCTRPLSRKTSLTMNALNSVKSISPLPSSSMRANKASKSESFISPAFPDMMKSLNSCQKKVQQGVQKCVRKQS